MDELDKEIAYHARQLKSLGAQKRWRGMTPEQRKAATDKMRAARWKKSTG